jgi:hypothetical protein
VEEILPFKLDYSVGILTGLFVMAIAIMIATMVVSPTQRTIVLMRPPHDDEILTPERVN